MLIKKFNNRESDIKFWRLKYFFFFFFLGGERAVFLTYLKYQIHGYWVVTLFNCLNFWLLNFFSLVFFRWLPRSWRRSQYQRHPSSRSPSRGRAPRCQISATRLRRSFTSIWSLTKNCSRCYTYGRKRALRPQVQLKSDFIPTDLPSAFLSALSLNFFFFYS